MQPVAQSGIGSKLQSLGLICPNLDLDGQRFALSLSQHGPEGFPELGMPKLIARRL